MLNGSHHYLIRHNPEYRQMLMQEDIMISQMPPTYRDSNNGATEYMIKSITSYNGDNKLKEQINIMQGTIYSLQQQVNKLYKKKKSDNAEPF
jgi:hypothetical protein